ncbi:MAG: APC family permease [Intrasporangiaceae bacterium]|nr:APC family permease [Intrasporangiaceae bacterium]
MSSDRLGETLLPKKVALPVFASDPLSSVAYAPDEIFLTLGLAGGALALTQSWKVALAVVVVMIVVVASYRQNVHAYPSGGGDYEVATVNLGPKAGLTVASALLVDYVLTVAVSISSGVQNAAAAFGFVRGHEVEVAVGLIVLLTAINLRGVRESGSLFALPTYLFMASIVIMAIVGAVRHQSGTLPQAESAGLELVPAPGYESLGTLALAFLVLRAFSSGCAALTGVEAISNGVPAFQRPKSRNAATTLLLMGTIAIILLASMVTLARWTGIKYAEDPATQLMRDGRLVGDDYVQHTIMGQVSMAVFDGFHVGVVVVAVVTGLILVLAANTAFNGFPVLGSILARDGYLPRQLHTRGDRLAYSNGIIILAGAAAALIVLFDAQVTKLIQLYIVGVFVSFTLSQLGMVRHWNRHLRFETNPRARHQMQRRRAINTVGAVVCGVVLVVVVVTKFTHGAGYAVAAMAALFLIMTRISKHYQRVSHELMVDTDETDHSRLPSRVHAIVLVSRIHKPALRALSYARATRPSRLEAITVSVDPAETKALQEQWERLRIPVQLKALDSPYREITRPVVEYVKSLRSDNPRDLVVVYVPEYVLGRWWEQLLHNQSALRLKTRMRFMPGVMVSSVPWQLRSSAGQEPVLDGPAPGDVRRGDE